MSQLSVECSRRAGKPFSSEAMLPLAGHHETPLSASTKMLERFPNNLPKHRENVIPADSEKSFEEVSGDMDGQAPAPASGAGPKASVLPLGPAVHSGREAVQGNPQQTKCRGPTAGRGPVGEAVGVLEESGQR